MKRLLFLSFLVLLGLFYATQPAYAVFGVGDIGLFDIPSMQLDALDFIDNVVMRFLFNGLLLLVESVVAITLAAAALNWASGLQIPMDSPFIQHGWGFLAGIVNLFLILIVVAMAFSAILKLDTFQMKKSLPKLIVVALLINFSTLFVGIFIDISQVFINTLKDAFGINFVTVLGQSISGAVGPIIATAGAMLLAKTIAALLPFANVASAVATGTYFLADLGAGKGWLLQGIVFTVFNFATASIFFLFAFLFIARVVVMSMLAIVAPLAFAAAVLPQTEKYWKQWYGLLLSWSLLGIVSLFLMGLGMRLYQTMTKFPSDGGFPATIFSNLFLLVYLAVAFQASRKFTPVAAEAIISQAKMIAGKGMEVGGKLFREGLGKDLARSGEQNRELRERAAAGEKLGFRGRLALASHDTGRWAYRTAFKTTPEADSEKRLEARVKKYEQLYGKDVARVAGGVNKLDTLVNEFFGGTPFGREVPGKDPVERTALALYLVKTGGAKGFGKLSKEQRNIVLNDVAKYSPDKIKDIVKHAPNLIDDPELGDLVQKALVPEGDFQNADGTYRDKDVQAIRETENITDKKDLIKWASYRKAMRAIKKTDVPNMDPGTWDNKEYQKAAAKYMPWNIAVTVEEEFANGFLQKLQNEAENIVPGDSKESLKLIVKTNPTLIPGVYSPVGRRLAREWNDPNRIGKPMRQDEAKKFIAEARKVPAPSGISYPLGPAAQEEIKLAAENRFNAQGGPNPKTLDEIQEEVRKEYEREYREPILKRIEQETNFLERIAEQNYSGQPDRLERATDERGREIYEELRLKKLYPSPKNTSITEENIFDAIVRTGIMPKESDSLRERKLTGALYKSFSLADEAREKIEDISKEIEKNKKTGKGTTGLEAVRANYERSYEEHRDRLKAIKQELDRIK